MNNLSRELQGQELSPRSRVMSLNDDLSPRYANNKQKKASRKLSLNFNQSRVVPTGLSMSQHMYQLNSKSGFRHHYDTKLPTDSQLQ